MAQALCMLDNYGYKHKLRICRDGQVTIWRKLSASWITMATNTNSEYVETGRSQYGASCLHAG